MGALTEISEQETLPEHGRVLAIQFELPAYLSSSKRNLKPNRQRHSTAFGYI